MAKGKGVGFVKRTVEGWRILVKPVETEKGQRAVRVETVTVESEWVRQVNVGPTMEPRVARALAKALVAAARKAERGAA